MIRKLPSVVVILLACSLVALGQGFWQPVGNGHAPVSGAFGEAVVGTGDALYLVRTTNVDTPPEFMRYVASSGLWETLRTDGLPVGAFRSGTALAWDGADTIYALLGGRQKEDTDRRDFYKYNLRELRWTKLANTPHPQGAGDALAWDYFGKRLYAFLGSSDRGSIFARYDPGRLSWETLKFNPAWDCTDDGAALASLGAFGLYALKGECHETEPNGDFALYIPSRLEWRQLPGLPVVGGIGDGGSLLWVGGFDQEQATILYALSGGTAVEDPGRQAFRFLLDANRWEKLADLPCPVGEYVGNRLGYVNGGVHYWQGSPQSERFECGGDGFYKLQGG